MPIEPDGTARSPARPPATRSRRPSKSGAAVINMSYGAHVALRLGVGPDLLRGGQGHHPRRRRRQRVRRRQPARVPGLAAARGHRRGHHAATTRARGSRTSTTRSTSARPASGSSTAVPKTLDGTGQDGYEALDGTSFAAPMVSAAMAWVRAARPELKPDQVVQAVRLTARDVLRPGWDPLTGFGVLNIGAALAVDAKRLPTGGPARAQRQPRVGERDGVRPRAGGGVVGRRGVKRVDATLDKQEDKIDVYRIVIPARPLGPDLGDPAVRRPGAGRVLGQRVLGQRLRRARRELAPVGQQADRAGHDRQPRQRKRARTTCRSRRRAPRATRSASTPCASASPLVGAGEAAVGERALDSLPDRVGLRAGLEPAGVAERVHREHVAMRLALGRAGRRPAVLAGRVLARSARRPGTGPRARGRSRSRRSGRRRSSA